MDLREDIKIIKELQKDGWLFEDIPISDVSIDTYIWTFEATEEGYVQKMEEAYEKKQIPFLDFCAINAVCAILKHPKRKEAVKIARKALLENDFKEPFSAALQCKILQNVYYRLVDGD
jgi:hypothetical protein